MPVVAALSGSGLGRHRPSPSFTSATTPPQKAIWDKIAKDYNAAHKGVKVQFKYLENEAFKAKLPTMLQSDDPVRDLFYSWAGGVMQAQDKAGFLKDITADVGAVEATMLPRPRSTRSRSTARSSACRSRWARSPSIYNKKLFEKAGVKAEDIKTWDDFLGAVKKLKAAGITPIVVGAGEKWPMHFYYSYLVMRIGGEHALADAKAGKDGGFKNATFVEAGKRLRELGALEPFQPGYLSTSHAQSAGMFGDGKAAMELMGQWLLGMQGPNSASGKGLPEEDIGIFSFPVLPGGKGKATDTLGGINGLLVTKTAPPEAVDFLKFFSQEKYAEGGRGDGRLYPGRQGRGGRDHRSAVQAAWPTISPRRPIIRTIFDQDLGPSVGRVINDISVAVAAGEMTPEAAAAAIQEAADQQ